MKHLHPVNSNTTSEEGLQSKVKVSCFASTFKRLGFRFTKHRTPFVRNLVCRVQHISIAVAYQSGFGTAASETAVMS